MAQQGGSVIHGAVRADGVEGPSLSDHCIHPTAQIDRTAILGEGVRVGPFCCVGPDVELGAGVQIGPFCYLGPEVVLETGTELVAQVTILGPTKLGAQCVVHPGAVLGSAPQDRSFAGERTELRVGHHTTIREQVTIHRGTRKGGGVTRVGSRCLLMVGVHVAHDCEVGDDVQLANLTTLAGHVKVASDVVSGGHVAVAPFVRLGRACYLAGGALVERDVPPFVIAAGDRARVRLLNRVGLARIGAPEPSRQALADAFRLLWGSGVPLGQGLDRIRGRTQDPLVAELVQFLDEARSFGSRREPSPAPSSGHDDGGTRSTGSRAENASSYLLSKSSSNI